MKQGNMKIKLFPIGIKSQEKHLEIQFIFVENSTYFEWKTC